MMHVRQSTASQFPWRRALRVREIETFLCRHIMLKTFSYILTTDSPLNGILLRLDKELEYCGLLLITGGFDSF